MKWIEPPEGIKRTRQLFLWWPVTCYHSDGSTETRWLERVMIRELLVIGRLGRWWCVTDFVDEKSTTESEEK